MNEEQITVITQRYLDALPGDAAEPVVNGDGPKLVHHTQANCVELRDALVGDVVDRVVAWCDAVAAVLIA
jgi:hypothetical protein